MLEVRQKKFPDVIMPEQFVKIKIKGGAVKYGVVHYASEDIIKIVSVINTNDFEGNYIRSLAVEADNVLEIEILA